MADEYFWNTSSLGGFNFNEDDLDINSESASSVLNSQKEESSSLPIHSIISKRNLDLILSDIEIKLNQEVEPSVEETTKNMFYGRKYVLNYRTIENKIKLLDAVIDTMDGNLMLIVTLFLSRTLSRSLFLHYLSKREVALRHYASFLIFNNKVQDLSDLYMATGLSSNLRVLCSLTIKYTLNKENLLSKLDQHVDCFQYYKDVNSDLNEYKNFIKWQIDKKYNCDSVLEQLALLYKNSESEVGHFQQIMKVSDFQNEWVHVNTLALMGSWQKLKDTYMSVTWPMKKKSFKSSVRPELFFLALNKHKPPSDLLVYFLTGISDSEKSLLLARKFSCYRFVIDYYTNQRDRLALVLYKNQIPVESPEFMYLESVVHSSDKKWKN